jgi:hypothetical protein
LLAALLVPNVAAAEPIAVGWPADPRGEFLITYSYSNLLDGSFLMIDRDHLRAATVEALSLWSGAAPLHFVEQPDSGPAASDQAYTDGDYPRVRIGHHPISDLAHTFQPGVSDGRGGDIHLDAGIPWTVGDGHWNFLEALVHELGHALGLGHEEREPAMMNPFFPQARFAGLGTGFLLPADIRAVQQIYGAGRGSVQPLDPVPESPTLLLVCAGLGALRRMSRLGAAGTESSSRS